MVTQFSISDCQLPIGVSATLQIGDGQRSLAEFANRQLAIENWQ